MSAHIRAYPRCAFHKKCIDQCSLNVPWRYIRAWSNVYYEMRYTMEETSKIRKVQLISAKDFGQLISLSKRQIFRLNSCGKIPAPIKIGGSLRFDLENDIKPWLAAGAPDRKTWEEMKQQGGEK